MNNDDKIFEVVQDLKAIQRCLGLSNGIDLLHESAKKLIENKSYSDINVKDEEGNTFLHYAMHADNYDWSEMLIRQGANPYIENNKGKNCFRMFRLYDSPSDFMKRFKHIHLENGFKKDTQGFCQEFKQQLFEENISHSTSFRNVKEIKDFLDSIELYSFANMFKILERSLFIKCDKKVEYFLNSNYEKEENSKAIASKFLHCLARIYPAHMVFESNDLKHKFFNCEFADNDDFKGSLIAICFQKSLSDTVLPNVIEVLFKQKFDLNKMTGGGNLETIGNFLERRNNTKSVFLKLKLDYSLQDNPKNKKVLKI